MKTLSAVGTFVPRLPASDGHWSGMRGGSAWIFDLAAMKWDIYAPFVRGRLHPTRPWGQIIRNCDFPNADRVVFRNSFPNFNPYIVNVIDNTGGRQRGEYHTPAGQTISGDRATNFRAADGWVARQLGCWNYQVQQLRSRKHLTWHEREDTTTIILVPQAIHGFVPHSGGIEVVNRGGIGSEREEAFPMEQRNINGEELVRVGDLDLWRRVKKTEGYTAGAGKEFTVSYVCDDPNAGPTPNQQAKAQELLNAWPELFGTAQKLLAEYVRQEWQPEGGDWQAWATELIVYQEVLWEQMTAGILCGFSLDQEHGLGVRILGDGSMMVGPEDIAL